jgi:DNA-binding transcriptional LysR family regulator
MDLNDIVVFTKVVETRSFTGAAEQLGLPKSTVSRKLAQLEERLGVRLVQRTTRKLALTEIGQAYYERCSQIVADVAAAEQLVTDMQATPRGRVRVTAPIDISSRYLGAICAGFAAAHPDVNVDLEATDRIVDLIEEGFDIAVRFGALPESTLIARRLCKIDNVLVATPAYLARHGAPATVEDLDAHDRVLFTPSARIQGWTLVHDEATYEFGRPARFASNNVSAVRDAVLAGAGISLLSEFVVAGDIGAGRLAVVLPGWRSRPVDAHAVYPARQNLPPRLSLFLDYLGKALDPVPWAAETARAAALAPAPAPARS